MDPMGASKECFSRISDLLQLGFITWAILMDIRWLSTLKTHGLDAKWGDNTT